MRRKEIRSEFYHHLLPGIYELKTTVSYVSKDGKMVAYESSQGIAAEVFREVYYKAVLAKMIADQFSHQFKGKYGKRVKSEKLMPSILNALSKIEHEERNNKA